MSEVDTHLRNCINFNNFIIKDTDYNNSCFYQAIFMNLNNNNINSVCDVQEKAYNWILQNWENIFESEYSIGILVNLCHSLDYNNYKEYYQHFAGDFIVGYKKNEIISIPERWGSYVEQIAISEISKKCIIVLSLIKYDCKNRKIISGRLTKTNDDFICKAYKDTQFKILQVTGKKYFSLDEKPMFLLWRKGKYGEHYMGLTPVNLDYEFIYSII